MRSDNIRLAMWAAALGIAASGLVFAFAYVAQWVVLEGVK